MAIKNYTTKTASLKATTADIRKLEANSVAAKSMSIDGVDVMGAIDDAEKAAKTAASEALSAAKTELEGKITAAQESAAIQVGRDADKNWSVDDTAIEMVKKISFLGDYVNVVPGENGEVKLYIGENKSLPDGDKSVIKDVPATTHNVLLYNDATDDYTLPSNATPNSTSVAVIAKKDASNNTNFGSSTLTARAKDDNNTTVFTLDQSDCIWVRTTYNYDTTSDWGKVVLTKGRGVSSKDKENDINVYTTTLTSVTVDEEAGEKALPSGVSMKVGNYPLTTANAKDGKIPNRCETQFQITFAWDTILTKDGGNVKVEWAIGSANEAGDAPASAVTINEFSRFFTEYKDATIASVDAVVKDSVYTSKVSGLEYLTEGTTVTVTTGNLSDTQYKSSAGTKRLNINAAGTSINYSTSELKCSEGSTTSSDAVYVLDETSTKAKETDSNQNVLVEKNVIRLGSTGTTNATVKATVHGFAEGGYKSKTIGNFWGAIPTSTSLIEKFGKESYRKMSVTSGTPDFDSTADVTTHDINVNGTSCVSAVCQYGKLYHPANAAPDAKGKTYSTDKPACFIRTFTNTSAMGKITLSATDLIQSGVEVWWYGGGSWYNLHTASVANKVTHKNNSGTTADTITKEFNTGAGEPKEPNVTIAIVIKKGATAIGPITASFSNN